MNALVTRSWSALRQWLPRRASWPRRLALPHWSQAPLLDRWLLSELIGPLLFGIAAFTAVSLSVGVVFELVRRVAETGLPLLAAGAHPDAAQGCQFTAAREAAVGQQRGHQGGHGEGQHQKSWQTQHQHLHRRQQG